MNPMAEEQGLEYIRNREQKMKNDALNMAYSMMDRQEKTNSRLNDYASMFLSISN